MSVCSEVPMERMVRIIPPATPKGMAEGPPTMAMKKRNENGLVRVLTR
jgi:hypothetical protein